MAWSCNLAPRAGSVLSVSFLLVLALGQVPAHAEDNPLGSFSQKPEAIPTNQSPATAGPAVSSRVAALLTLRNGPAPSWIWGPDKNSRYVLKKTFQSDSSSDAWLIATCDNRMSLDLNGKRIATSDQWQQPVVMNVQQFLVPGENQLNAEVANEGGASGFTLKLVQIVAMGRQDIVLSDESWTAVKADDPSVAAPALVLAEMGKGPWGNLYDLASENESAARGEFNVLPGFHVERLFTVPGEELGSWVSITFDPKGRLIVSDQADKGLCRITLPKIGSDEPTRVERLALPITSAQGLLCAFDSLYISVNGGPGSGLYRAQDTDGDDQYDKLEKLKDLQGAGEHGPHALRLSPDGKSIFLVCGNHTYPVEPLQDSRVPRPWQEDLLLPRQWDANGHAVGRMAPGGWIARTDPDGQNWEMFSIGYRNSYDFDFNTEGELFAYDSDMEWDIGMPWYRPTRAVHATRGSEFGWRSGTGKWPPSSIDSLPPLSDIGPGSPVGVAFGQGARFPARYQEALYLCDWTFGTIYALHLEPEGSSYKAIREEFLSATPLPLTDIAIGPDGALYFTIGGRGTQSELFRVTYVGEESTAPAKPADSQNADLRALRRQLESLHHPADDQSRAIDFIYPNLGHADRFVAYAARVALEHQPAAAWQQRVLDETNPQALLQGAVALARQGDASLQPEIIKTLDRLDINSLPESDKLALLRVYQLAFLRMGEPDAATAQQVASRIDAFYPAATDALNRELCNLLVYLKSPTVVAKTLELLKGDRPTEAAAMAELLARNPSYGGPIARMLANQPDAQKISYAMALRNVKEGWSLDQRKAYFAFLERAREWSGGASYQGFIRNIDREAFDNATEDERLAIEAAGARAPYKVAELPTPKGPGQTWSLDQVMAAAGTSLQDRDFENGRTMFAAARCVVCHRFAGEGGATGPDLTQAAGRFGVKDLAEAILEPGKVVSDQYRATTVATTSGQVYTGRLVNDAKNEIWMLTDPEDPTKSVRIPRAEIDEIAASASTLMPEKLIDTLNQDEVLDLIAYLLSRGEPKDPMFKQTRRGRR